MAKEILSSIQFDDINGTERSFDYSEKETSNAIIRLLDIKKFHEEKLPKLMGLNQP